MKRSFVKALKQEYCSAYMVDHRTGSCHILFSDLFEKKYEGIGIGLERFQTLCTDALDEECRQAFSEFLDASRLRTSFINGKTYEMVYGRYDGAGDRALYRAIMFPENGDTGLICVRPLLWEISAILGQRLPMDGKGKALGLVRIRNNPALTIEYADERFYQCTGYTAEEIKRDFKNGFGRLALQDMFKLLNSFSYDEAESLQELSVKIRRKAGGTVWMRCLCLYDQNAKAFNIAVTDISDQILQKDMEHLKNEIKKMLLEGMELTYFLYDVERDLMTVTLLTADGSGRKFTRSDHLQNIDAWENVHPDDRRNIGVAFSKLIRQAVSKEKLLCRYAFTGEGYRNGRMIMKGVRTTDGRLYRIVGKIEAL